MMDDSAFEEISKVSEAYYKKYPIRPIFFEYMANIRNRNNSDIMELRDEFIKSSPILQELIALGKQKEDEVNVNNNSVGHNHDDPNLQKE